jgi:hypothetical protein
MSDYIAVRVKTVGLLPHGTAEAPAILFLRAKRNGHCGSLRPKEKNWIDIWCGLACLLASATLRVEMDPTATPATGGEKLLTRNSRRSRSWSTKFL